jgi:multiple sugar transport system ATP-binding protein
VAPEGLIARIPPLERHAKGKPVKLGAEPDHCHLFDSNGLAFRRRIAQELAA